MKTTIENILKDEIRKLIPEIDFQTDNLYKELYSYDASMIKAKPSGVIHISDIENISKVLKVLYKYSIPFTPRGAGTNLTGGATNQKGGVVINLAGCQKIHQIDTLRGIAKVEPGVINLKLQHELEKFNFFYPPDPASQSVSTIGGNIAENSGGPRCLKYGVTLNNVHAIEVVLPNGEEIYLSVDDKGPELINLFIGSEGTLGIIKTAYLKIIPKPNFKTAIYCEFSSLEDTMQTVEEIIRNGFIPSALEAVDKLTLQLTTDQINSSSEGALIIELDANTNEELQSQIEGVESIVKKYALKIKKSSKKDEIDELFRIRKEAYPSLARIANNVLVEDGCVPLSNLTKAVKEIQQVLVEENLKATLVFHAGDGNIHPNIVFDERDIKEANRIRKVAYRILEIYLKHNGTISAEHGIGVEKRAFVAAQYDETVLSIVREIKSSIDEKNISNPDKKIPLSSDVPKIKNKRVPYIDSNTLMIKKEIEKRYTSNTKTAIVGITPFIEKENGFKKLSSSNLKDIVDFDRKNLLLIVESGMNMKVLNEFLQNEGFKTIPYNGSIGSFISKGEFLEIRNILLMLEVILSDGRILSLGSKNMKDTSIYEIMRLFIGSQGSLGFITKVGLRIFKGENEIKLTPKKMNNNITSIHKKIKTIFDPKNLFNPFLTKELYGDI